MNDTSSGLSTLYALASSTTGLIKIGHTTNPLPARIRQLETACGLSLELVAAIPGPRSMESVAHRRFAAYRKEGEWFQDCPEIRAALSGDTSWLVGESGSDTLTRRAVTRRTRVTVGLRRAIAERGLTISGFASACGISRDAVNKWLRGSSTPRDVSMAKIAATLGITIDEVDALVEESATALDGAMRRTG